MSNEEDKNVLIAKNTNSSNSRKRSINDAYIVNILLSIDDSILIS